MEGTGGQRNSMHGSYSENNWRLLAQRSTGLALYALPNAASLIVTLLLSIGLGQLSGGLSICWRRLCCISLARVNGSISRALSWLRR
jgi:hypothetical protein